MTYLIFSEETEPDRERRGFFHCRLIAEFTVCSLSRYSAVLTHDRVSGLWALDSLLVRKQLLTQTKL